MTTSKVDSFLPAKIPHQTKQLRLLESKLLSAVSSRDLFRLTKQLQKLKGFADKPKEQALLWQKWSDAVSKSANWVEKRSASFPEINFPDLPVSGRADEIRELIENNQVVVIAGETGSGKTTQLPKICLQAGCGRRGLIGHTQPRRIAARSVASRLAEELKTPLGDKGGLSGAVF